MNLLEPPEKVYDGIFIGRLHPQKGLPDLVDIWERVVQKRPESKLAIIGGGSKEWSDWLESEIATRGLENNIDFLGFKIGEEKIKLLQSAKVFMMSSHYESWGMTAVEAMSAGLPVVGYDIPVFQEVFPEAMIKVPFEDKEAFVKQVLELLNDEYMRSQKAANSKSFVWRYDWSKVAEIELSILQQ